MLNPAPTGRRSLLVLLGLALLLPVGAWLQPWLWPSRSDLPAVPKGIFTQLVLITVAGLPARSVGHLQPDGGQQPSPTPVLDQLAHEGVTFTRFWAASNDPSSNLASLHTGLSPERTGVRGPGDVPAPGVQSLAAKSRTRGQSTLALLAHPRATGPGLARHFETQVVDADAGVLFGLARAALHEQKQVFVWIDLPAIIDGAGVAAFDAQLGRFVAGLREDMSLENAFLCVTGTGSPTGEPSLGEDVVRVPFVLRMPGEAIRGRRHDMAAGTVDLAPTLADLSLGTADLPGWEALCGKSLLPRMSMSAPTPARATVVHGQHGRNPKLGSDRPSVALLVDRYKLIVPEGGDGPAELYDLSADPHELRDLAADRIAVTLGLRRRLEQWRKTCGEL